ncbi:MAG: sigma-54-dependent transcriptional regulator [Saprospiraceae bacterium]
MSINVVASKIFLLSTNSNFIQNLTTFFSSKFELSIFENDDLLFQNIHQRPTAIFLEIENELTDVVPFLDKMLNFDKNIPIILISKNNNITSFDFSLKSNVYDCFQKEELTDQRLYFLLKNISQTNLLQNQLEKLDVKIHHNIVKNMVYNCASMQRVTQLIDKACSTNIPCYISGGQGTGKGTSAYLIHYLSSKKPFPYLYLRLSTIEPDNLEKEFFGYENYQNQIFQEGKLELANGGTLYLEDIHLLPLSFQTKFLKAIKLGYFQRIGGSENIPINFRIITSSSKNLLLEMEAGDFLESLYYRLMGLTINIPPLKDRSNDIILLANNIMNEFFEKNNSEKKVLSKEAKQKLLSYSFPGNIRELKSIIERAMVLSDENIITEDDIEFGNSSNQISFLEQNMTFEEYKSKIIHHFLKKYNHDIQIVSTKLDIGKSTIYRMLKSEKEKNTKKITWFNLF